jgi:ribulose-5-phosphate 4-epimerase/fuculose-1-phosphate aldolase
MNKQEAINSLLAANSFFEIQSESYKSWGNVNVLQIALRISAGEFLVTDVNKSLGAITAGDINLQSISKDVFSQIFTSRKRINTILITQQEYASQLQEEVPAILDDQAQLLGVSIRLAKNESQITKSLSGRFAVILSDKKSICLGTSIDDAYVAAQLLEKTSKVFIEAKHLGGAKAINKIEAWLMQQYYQFKYSKEAVKNR